MDNCRGFDPIIRDDARFLVLGSMPSVRSLSVGEYYGNKNNRFWSLMANIFGVTLSRDDYAEKIGLLFENKVALWDVLSFCERKGSLDSNIHNEKSNDFIGFFERYRNLRVVLFNGNKAFYFFKKYNENLLDSSNYSFFVLPSTSPANTAYSFDRLLLKWRAVFKNE